jgi:hypothetical protein
MLDYTLRTYPPPDRRNSILNNSFSPLRIIDILCNLPHSRKSIIIELFNCLPTRHPPSEPPIGHQPQ